MSRNQDEAPTRCKNCGKTTIRDYDHNYNIWCDDGVVPEPDIWQCINCGILMSKNGLGGIELGRVERIILAPGEYGDLTSSVTKRNKSEPTKCS